MILCTSAGCESIHFVRVMLHSNFGILYRQAYTPQPLYNTIVGVHSRVLTRILKIGVKCCPPEKVGVLPYLSIETFQKIGVRNEKLE